MSRRVTFPIPDTAERSACRSCKAPIAWVWVGVTAKSPGKRMPISLTGAEKNVLGELEGESHFSDCPDADKWRKPR